MYFKTVTSYNKPYEVCRGILQVSYKDRGYIRVIMSAVQYIFIEVCSCALQHEVLHCAEVLNQVSLFSTDTFPTYVGVPFLKFYITRNLHKQ